jgi:hypothetical protein
MKLPPSLRNSGNVVPLVLLVIIMAALPFACKKADFSPTNDPATFNVASAKEWWYGTFRKSADFKQVSNESPLVKMAMQGSTISQLEKQQRGRLPSWRNAKQMKLGSTTVVELPLFGGSNLVPIAEADLSNSDGLRLAALAQQKLLITTKGNGQPSLRVVTLVPSLKYAKAKNFDVGHLLASNLPADFEGDIIVADWAGNLKAAWRKTEGKAKKRLSPRLHVSDVIQSNDASMANMVCEQVYAIVGYHYYCIAAPQGDEPVEDACNRNPDLWRQGNPIWDWVYLCNDGDGGGGDMCPPELSEEECICQLYGLGCDGGVGDEDLPPPPPDPCNDAQPASNAATTLSQNISYRNAKSNIQTANPNVENTVTFGKDVNGNVSASTMTSCTNPSNCTVNTNYPGGFADLHNHPSDLPPSPGDMYNLIGVNNNHSGYNTRMVVTPDGSVYALVVLDLAAANTFKNTYSAVDMGYGPDFPSEIYVKFDEVKDQFILQGLSLLIAEERALAYVLDLFNTGVALLKQDSNGSFKRLKTDGNTSNGKTTYTSTNCQ